MKWLLLGFVVLACAGCKRQIDEAKVESAIRAELAKLAVEAKIKCPKNEPAKQGHTFQCNALVPATADNLTFDVTVTDGDGTIAFELAGTLVDTAVLLADIKKTTGSDNLELTCPSKVIFVRQGKSADCEIRAAGKTAKLQIFEEDAQKHVAQWKVVGEPVEPPAAPAPAMP